MSLLSRLAVQAARAYGILSSRSNNISADFLVVAGGGPGGYSGNAYYKSGGGGAGGFRTSAGTSGGGASAESPLTLSTLNTYSIVVGAGGATNSSTTPSNGSNSSISGTGLTTITSIGGGYGGPGPVVNNGSSGGSGGGSQASSYASNTTWVGGSGTTNQGYAGGTGYFTSNTTVSYNSGAGGGGAGSVGGDGVNNTTGNGGNGGNGVASSISGSSVTYAGGGGGGGYSTGGTASGGGGAGGSGTVGTAGTANTGGGGGGSAGTTTAITNTGGSGIVIISYTSATPKFVGGTITTSGGKQIHTFTSSGTLSPITPITASYLVVAGGGAGGALKNGFIVGGGGGGAGGLLTSSTTLYSGATYVVTVGAGGAGVSAGTSGSGSNSVVSGTGLTTITATGGGGGGWNDNSSGIAGGSGGGGANGSSGGAGTSGQGSNGGGSSSSGGSGGGGGASAVGSNGSSVNGGNGGAGTSSSISGSAITYAGGGGGGGDPSSGGTSGTGGAGGGGNAGATANSLGGSGTANLGGGGGGCGGSSTATAKAGGNGGSGIVIISYAGSQQFNGGLVTSSGGNTIHTFTSTGALTPLTNNLNNSLRFRSSASAYLNRTPTLASDRQKFTFSYWLKRGTLGVDQQCYGIPSTVGTQGAHHRFNASDNFRVNDYTNGSSDQIYLVTTQVFRDPSAWYHIVIAVDTTQATAANRVKLYVNGNQVTAFSTATYPSQNQNLAVNQAKATYIGYGDAGSGGYFDGYLADFNFIDGQALEPYYFGNNDANGVWKPIQYKGTYGTNGFYLTFGNTTSTTTLGYDSSPNGNNWTCNNISLTAGTTYDAMTDVPTNTSATVANYAVWSSLVGSVGVTLSQANLSATFDSASGTRYGTIGTIGVSSGKWYWEYEFSAGGNSALLGITQKPFAVQMGTWPGEQTGDYGYFGSNGNKYTAGSGSAYGATFTTGDIIGVALDLDAGTLTFYKNNSSQGTAFSSISGTFFPAIGKGITATGITSFVNFGQRPFSYTPPTGYVALNTYNLPTPTILQGNKYMDATTYNGSDAPLTIVNQAQFKPDFMWAKSRSGAYSNILINSVTGGTKYLITDNTNAEQTLASLCTFNSNGVTWGVGGAAGVNAGGITYVGWQWQAGQGSTSSNTSGSITSTVSVNTTAGFSVVTYTGTGANATVGHGLGVAPKMVIVKRRDSTGDWLVWNSVIAASNAANVLFLNATNAQTANSSNFNSTAPTSTVFSVGTNAATNASGGTHVAYCWAEIAGFSAFGSYTGNGSTDGPFIYTGFRPKYVMIKVTSTTEDWYIWDTSRGTYNANTPILYADLSAAESTSAIDTLSNGFKCRTAQALQNSSGATYIYMAFAENPFKNANAR